MLLNIVVQYVNKTQSCSLVSNVQIKYFPSYTTAARLNYEFEIDSPPHPLPVISKILCFMLKLTVVKKIKYWEGFEIDWNVGVSCYDDISEVNREKLQVSHFVLKEVNLNQVLGMSWVTTYRITIKKIARFIFYSLLLIYSNRSTYTRIVSTEVDFTLIFRNLPRKLFCEKNIYARYLILW